MSSRKTKTEKVQDNNRKDTSVTTTLIGAGATIIVALIGVLTVWIQKQPANTPLTATPINVIAPTSTQLVISYNGSILHDKDGGLQTFSSGVNLENFEAKVDFFAPSNAQEKPWNFAILFRVEGDIYKGYRIWVNANNNTWGYSFWDGSGFTYLASEQRLPDNLLMLNESEKNSLTLRVYKDNGCFYVNDKFVSLLNLSDIPHAGNIALALDGKEYQFDGGVTRFANFTVSEISELNCTN